MIKPKDAAESAGKRKPLRRILFLLLIAFLLFGLQKAYKVWSKSKSVKDEVPAAVFRDLYYADGSKDPYQSLDIFIPRKPKSLPMPLIVWIHGGAWMAGDKNHPPIGPVLSRGYALASLNYRLSQQAPHPAQIHDCKASMRYIAANAKKYKIDMNRVGVWGHSAGGHLAALMGTSNNVKELEGNLGNESFSSSVQAAAEWAGPSDLASIASQAPANCKIDFKSPTNPVAGLLGPNQSLQAHLAASPVQYVDKDDPPFFILHAEDDDIVPVGQARELSEILKRFGVEHYCRIPERGGHALSKGEFIDETMDFFDKHLPAN